MKIINTIREKQRFYRFLPFILKNIQNWKDYLATYSGHFTGVIQFRNGIKLVVDNSHCANLINIIFFQKIYGKIKNQKVILEIGGNRGYFSVYSAMANTKAKVFVFEPDPRAFDLLSQNIKLNKLTDRVNIYNEAVAAKKQMMTLYLGENSVDNSLFNIGEHQHSLEVNCRSIKQILDKLITNKIDLIKFNCEGAEYEILFSLDETYLDRIQEIRMEYHLFKQDSRVYKVDDIISFLQKFGFKTTRLSKYAATHGILWMSK